MEKEATRPVGQDLIRLGLLGAPPYPECLVLGPPPVCLKRNLWWWGLLAHGPPAADCPGRSC